MPKKKQEKPQEEKQEEIDPSTITEKQTEDFFETGELKLNESEESKEEEETSDKEVSDEETPQESAEPEKTDEKAVEKEDGNKYVRLEALQEERIARKEMSSKLKQIEKKNEDLIDTFNKFVVSLEQQKNQPEIPSFEEDPVAHLSHKTNLQEQELNKLKKYADLKEGDFKESARQQKVVAEFQSEAMEYLKEEPHFAEAEPYLINKLYETNLATGLPHQQAYDAALKSEFAIIERAMSEGKNPAEIIYEVSKAQGFLPKEKVEEKKEEKAGQKSNGSDIEKIEAKLAAGQSLSNVSGETVKNPDLMHLADMLQDETISDDEKNKRWRQLIGQYAC